MKAYVYLAVAAALTGCAYGSIGGDHGFHDDGGVTHIDAGGHDAKAPIEAAAQDVSQPLDQYVAPTCNPLPLGTGLAACDTCIGASCCSQDQACGGDPNCMSFINCIGGCMPTDGGPPDPQCQSTCASTYPTGANELSNLDSCMSAACRTQCMGP